MNQGFQSRRGYGRDFLARPAVQERPDTLSEILLAARRQAWVVVVCAIAGLALGLLHYATTPKTYQAAATLLVEERQSELREEISATLPTARSDTSMMNELQILGSLEIASDVVRALDLSGNPNFTDPPQSLLGSVVSGAKSAIRALIPQPAPQPAATGGDGAGTEDLDTLRAAQRLRLQTDLRRVGRSFVVEIWYESHDPVLATEIVNAYADAYLADGIEANVEAAMRTAGWMDDRLQELRAAALEAAEEAERFRLENGAADQQGLRERQSRAEALNELVEQFQVRSQEAALESSFPVSTGRILSRALPPRDPAAPKGWQVLAGGMVLGLFAALLIAVAREMRETGFRTGADVTDALGVPFLGYLPVVRSRDVRKRGAGLNTRVRFAAPPPAWEPGKPALPQLMARDRAMPLDIAPPGGPSAHLPATALLASRAPASEAGRAFAGLYANIDLSLAGQSEGRILAIGALTGGEGASHVASNLAHAAACAGRRVLLVDADLAGAGLTKRMGAEGAPGTVDVLDGLVGIRDAVRHVPEAGHCFLPTGAQADTGPVSPYMADFATLLTELRAAYDDIFVDLPPLSRSPEVKTLLRAVENIVLVTAWGRTPRKMLTSWLDHEGDLHRRILGVVLNRAEPRRLPLYGVVQPSFRPGRA
ncbi:hypothetical protein HKCCE2091_02765 [Rhodobacterales bacterium HKCCE2091]|nr:hypothetical protein [Rhodobacterales bacterium HKCCE2091]